MYEMSLYIRTVMYEYLNLVKSAANVADALEFCTTRLNTRICCSFEYYIN